MASANCPSCGKPLNVPEGVSQFYCSYCGTLINVSVKSYDTGIEADGTIRDRSTGYGLFRVPAISGWQVSGTTLRRTGTSSRPYLPSVELNGVQGGFMNLAVGEAGTRNSTAMNAMLAMYGSHLIGIDTINYAPVPDPIAAADSLASQIAGGMGASDLCFVQQLDAPALETQREIGFNRFKTTAQATSGLALVANPLAANVLRIYSFTAGGQPWKMAACVKLDATKEGMNLGEGMGGALGGIAEQIGDAFSSAAAAIPNPFASDYKEKSSDGDPYSTLGGFLMGGGLVGKMKRDREAAQRAQAQGEQVTVPPREAVEAERDPASGAVWSLPEFSSYTKMGTIFWSVSLVATLVSPEKLFAEQFNEGFLPVIKTIEAHPDIERLCLDVARQEALQVQQATQTQINVNQANFQAQQAAHRQVQQAYDSYNQAWHARSDAHHAQFRAASNSMFNTAGTGTASPDYSEAIRGVNTFTTSDGREVELSVNSDRAYENQAGDVIGGSGGFDPGADWTEIPRT